MKISTLSLALSAALICSPLRVFAECTRTELPDQSATIVCSMDYHNSAVVNVEAGTTISVLNAYFNSPEPYALTDSLLTIQNSGTVNLLESHISYVGNISLINDGLMEGIFLTNSVLNREGGNTESFIHIKNNGDISSDIYGIDVSSINASLSNYGSINSPVMFFSGDNFVELINHEGAEITLNRAGELAMHSYLEAYSGNASLQNAGTMSGSHLFVTANNVRVVNSGVMNFIGLEYEGESHADAGLYLTSVSGMSTELINSGSIIGSVRMDGLMNRLSLMDDWSISGFVTAPYSFENRSNILNLTGDQDSALDLSRVQRVFDTAMAMLPKGSTAIDGFDTLIKDGNSRWNLTGEQLSGGFNSAQIQQGGLLLNNATLRMALVDGTTRDDFVYPDSGESLGEGGIRRSVAIAPAGSLLVAGAAKVVGGLSNAGQLYINDGTSSSATFNTLNITGDYAGLPGSTVIFNTALGDDSSSTDRLIIAGSTSGESAVVVNNLGGSGAQTVEGIGLISVGGSSDATFNKQSRIVAGSFDYDLVKKGSDWVLTSQFVPEDSTDDSENSTGGNEENSGGSEGSTGGSEGNTGGNEDNIGGNESSTDNGSSAGVPAAGVRTWRPEAGSYSANLLAANTLFGTSLQDRTGEGYYTDALTGERKATSMWLRNAGGYQRSRMNDGQNTTRANQYVLQLGGDLAQWSTNGQDGIHAGVMAGYANQKSRTTSGLTGYRSRGTTNGYSTGLYATWYENEAAREGLYVDGWLQYSWFDHSVKGDEIAAEYYRSRGFTGSLESGYAFRAGGTGSADKRGTGFWLEPQVQATWMGVKASDVIEHNGTRVQARGQDNLRSRLGIKAYARSEGPATGANDAEFRPYIQTSWIHDSNNFGVRMDGTDSIVAGTRNVAEVKVGLESRLNSDVNLWGDISHQAGDHGFSDSQAALGIRYAF